MNDIYQQKITTLAKEFNYAVDFYNSFDGPTSLASSIGDYEIIYGHPPPSLLQNAHSLRWICSDFAGIEGYLDDRLFPHPGILLSNSSGAYGAAISEHIVMVSLMLLRRMQEYQVLLAKREWPDLTPIRSIIGSQVVIVGTGDIGSNTARRMKALGANVTGVCRSGKSNEKSFDKVVCVDQIEEQLKEADLLILALPETNETKGIDSNDEKVCICCKRWKRKCNRPRSTC